MLKSRLNFRFERFTACVFGAGTALFVQNQEGNHYDIIYNPVNANFFVEGKNGSEMLAQSIEGAIDPDCTDDVTQEDDERFRAIASALSNQAFNRNQSPAETQALAYDRWAEQQEAVENHAALLDSLRGWYLQAKDLGRSESHLKKIEAIGTAVKEGDRDALTSEDAAVMERDLRAWQQQVATVAQQAQVILNAVGQMDEGGVSFEGKTYALSRSDGGALRIQAGERGEILRMDGDEIRVSRVNAGDAERFQQFAERVQQSRASMERRLAGVGLER